jgi:GNAT superfamily N-acetyltransferase
VLDLLRLTLGEGPTGTRTHEYLAWKHFTNPFGPSYMMVATIDERLIGLRAFMQWRFRAGHRTLKAVQAVDTATHPDFQGMGVFSRLTRSALERIRGELDLVYNTPNDKSLPGYLKMGWEVVGSLPVSVRLRRPIRFARAIPSLTDGFRPERPKPASTAAPISTIITREDELVDLLSDAEDVDDRVRTLRDVDFLRWRYADAPGLDYRIVSRERRGRLEGFAIFRVRPRGTLWETALADVIVRHGDPSITRELVRDVVAAASVDHVTCSFPRGSAVAKAARRRGFLKSPAAITLVVNPLGSDFATRLASLDAWALCLGDVEVF